MSANEGADQRNLLRHASNYLSASAFRGVLAFVSVGILTRLLTPGDYGVVAIYSSIAALFGVLTELNLRSAVARYYLEESEDFPSFLQTCLTFLGAFITLLLTVLWFAREPLAGLFEIAPLVFFAGVVAAALQVPWNFTWKLMVAQQRSGAFARLSVVKDSLVLVLAVSITYSLDHDRHWGVIGGNLTVAFVLACWLGMRLIFLAKPGHFNREHLRYALLFGVPLIPHALSGYLLNTSDRIIINQLRGAVESGHYSFAYDVGSVMNTVVTACNQAWFPIFTRHRNRNQYEAIGQLARTYAVYICLAAVVLATFAREIVVLLADESFYAALDLIPIVVFSYVFVFIYTIYSGYSFYRRRTGWISSATLVAGAVNVGLNYWLIPTYGMVAAAWTTLASYALLMVLHYAIARWLLAESVVGISAILTPLGIATLVALGVAFTERWLDDSMLALAFVKLPVLALCGWVGYRLYQRKPERTS